MTAVRRLATAGRAAAGRAELARPTSHSTLKGLAVPGSCPYPWPFDGSAGAAGTALLVVAAQRAVASHCPGASGASAAIGDLVVAFRAWGAHVVWTRHARTPVSQAAHRQSVLPAAHGPERGPAGRQPSDLVVHAYGLDAFSASPLAQGLRGLGVEHLLVAGFGLEGPVHSTLRSANDRGWECLLVADACAAFEPALAPAALSTVESGGGVFGATAKAREVLVALDHEGASRPARRRRR